jgi:hypothetical protein
MIDRFVRGSEVCRMRGAVDAAHHDSKGKGHQQA